MKNTTVMLLAIGLATLTAVSASAANYAITAEIIQASDVAFNVLPTIPDITKNSGVPRYYLVNFTLFTSGFLGGQNQRGFANMVFDINLSGNSLPTTGQNFGWGAFNPIVDTNGPELSGGNFPLWFANEDIATPNDLKSILLDIETIPNPHPADPRAHIGESGGTSLGIAQIFWDGLGVETLSVEPVVFLGNKQISFARLDNGLAEVDTAAVFTGGTITFGVTPVSGDFDGDGDVDGADFVVWQTNFPRASGATLNDGDGDGDGDVDGADFVLWQNGFPSAPAPGMATVPEPATWMLAAIGGLIAFRRRR
jgi:hypothetical protein